MTIKLPVYNDKGDIIEEIEIPAGVFAVKANLPLIHQVLTVQLNNERVVLAHTKDRSEVRGGGRKPWRQKGTGRARHGSIRSPLWIGGGVTFGPTKERNYAKSINRKMRQKALLMVLSDKIANRNCAVVERLPASEYKTKGIAAIIGAIEEKAFASVKSADSAKGRKKAKRSALLINDQKNDKLFYSSRNITGLSVLNLENINIVDLLKHRDLIISKEAVKMLGEKYSDRFKDKKNKEG